MVNMKFLTRITFSPTTFFFIIFILAFIESDKTGVLLGFVLLCVAGIYSIIGDVEYIKENL